MVPESSNKGILKNTVYLYIRSAVMMIMSLYTSRVVLATLGVSDFGIYNVVGGSVAMMSALSATLAGATQRFITVSIGKNNKIEQRKTFTAALLMHFCLGLLLLVLGESVGLLFINNQLNIDSARLFAANCVYQGALLCFLLDLTISPYRAVIVAHAKFKFYSNIDICRSLVYFVLILALKFSPADYLLTYAIIQLSICLLFNIAQIIYAIRYLNCKPILVIRDINRYKEIFSFSTWSFFGTASSIIYNQSCSIIINIFYGITLNATLGITNQVVNSVNTLVGNFSKAIEPEITKSSSSGNRKRSHDLVNLGVKLSSILLLIIGFPLVINIDYILSVWLVKVPQDTSQFITLSIVSTYIASMVVPFNTLLYAIGNIKQYQIICFLINIFSTLLLYLTAKYTNVPEAIFIILSIQYAIKLFALLHQMYKKDSYNVKDFINGVYLRCVMAVVFLVPIFIVKYKFFNNTTIVNFIYESILALIVAIIVSLYCICSEEDRKSIILAIKSKFIQ